MTTLDRDGTALLVVDVQNGIVGEAYERDRVVGAIAGLVGKARAAGTPVIWVQHNAPDLPRDGEAWQYVPELAFADGEPVVQKEYADSFEDTDLEQVLADGGIGSLIVVGAQTDECIRSTLHGAVARGYDALLVGDAHTTEDLSEWGAPTPDKVITHTNMYWSNHRAPGRTAGVKNAADVTF